MLLNLESPRAMEGQPSAPPSDILIVETRFGTYEFTSDETIAMPYGLVGFPDQQLFGLGNLPSPVPEDFKLLQSFGELPISFIVLPVAHDALPIDAADIKDACDAVGFDQDETHVMFLCSIWPKNDGEGVDIFANVRAPLLVDLEAHQARQFVLRNDRYPLRQPLDTWNGEV